MSENTQLTGRQIAAGRVLAGIGQADLAASSNISIATLRRMEASATTVVGMPNNVSAVRRSLEAFGVIFVAGNGDGPGVRLRRERAPLRYNVSHLHLLWDRAAPTVAKEMPKGASVAKVETGLKCLAQDGTELGTISFDNGVIQIDPRPIKSIAFEPDRIAPVDLERWLECVRLQSGIKSRQ